MTTVGLKSRPASPPGRKSGKRECAAKIMWEYKVEGTRIVVMRDPLIGYPIGVLQSGQDISQQKIKKSHLGKFQINCCYLAYCLSYISPELNWTSGSLDHVIFDSKERTIEQESMRNINFQKYDFHVCQEKAEIHLISNDTLSDFEATVRKHFSCKLNPAAGGLLIRWKDYCLMMWKRDHITFIYDPMGRTGDCRLDQRAGRQILMCFKTLTNACHLLLQHSNLKMVTNFSVKHIKFNEVIRDDTDLLGQYEIVTPTKAVLSSTITLRACYDIPVNLIAILYTQIYEPCSWTFDVLREICCQTYFQIENGSMSQANEEEEEEEHVVANEIKVHKKKKQNRRICKKWKKVRRNRKSTVSYLRKQCYGEFCSINDMPSTIIIRNTQITYDILPNQFVGQIKTPSNATENQLLPTLQSLFDEHQFAIIEVANFMVAMWKTDTLYYIFYPRQHRSDLPLQYNKGVSTEMHYDLESMGNTVWKHFVNIIDNTNYDVHVINNIQMTVLEEEEESSDESMSSDEVPSVPSSSESDSEDSDGNKRKKRDKKGKKDKEEKEGKEKKDKKERKGKKDKEEKEGKEKKDKKERKGKEDKDKDKEKENDKEKSKKDKKKKKGDDEGVEGNDGKGKSTSGSSSDDDDETGEAKRKAKEDERRIEEGKDNDSVSDDIDEQDGMIPCNRDLSIISDSTESVGSDVIPRLLARLSAEDDADKAAKQMEIDRRRQEEEDQNRIDMEQAEKAAAEIAKAAAAAAEAADAKAAEAAADKCLTDSNDMGPGKDGKPTDKQTKEKNEMDKEAKSGDGAMYHRLAVIGTKGKSAATLKKLLITSLSITDRSLIMTPWKFCAVFRYNGGFYLYNGCTCDVNVLRRCSLSDTYIAKDLNMIKDLDDLIQELLR